MQEVASPYANDSCAHHRVVVVVVSSLVVNNKPRSELKLMLLNYLIAVVLVRLCYVVCAHIFFFFSLFSLVLFSLFILAVFLFGRNFVDARFSFTCGLKRRVCTRIACRFHFIFC